MDNRSGKFGRIQTFVKEICQNSKDASNSSAPVRVEFNRFFMEAKDFPDVESYKEVIDKCIDTEEEGGVIGVTLARFKGFRRVLNNDKIPVLRVSDFNTTGLRDSKERNRINSRWSLATITTGISDKGGDQGGSYGRGKGAYFEVSQTRSVFFSTRDDKGIEASMGVAMLMSFHDEDVIRSHMGRCGTYDGSPVYSQLVMEGSEFERKERSGTDIYITGYEDVSDEWESPIIISVIHDFFFSIIEGDLIVTVGETVIDSRSIHRILERYLSSEQDFGLDLHHLHACIMAMSGSVVCYPETKPRYKLYLKPNDELNGVMAVRSGMTIYDKYYTPKRMYLVGVFAIIDPKVSSLLKHAENITHNKWTLNDLPEDSQEAGRRALNEMYQFVLNESDKLYKRKEGTAIDAAGIERYLYKEDATQSDISKAVKDSQFAPIHDVQVTTHITRLKRSSRNNEKELLPAKTPDDDEPFEHTGALKQKDRQIESDVPKRAVPDTDPKDGSQPFERFFKTKPIIKNVRVCADASKRYSIWFDTDNAGGIYLEAKQIIEGGETGRSLDVTSASIGSEDIHCNGSIIGPIMAVAGARNKICLSIAYPVLCSIRLEVKDDGQ